MIKKTNPRGESDAASPREPVAQNLSEASIHRGGELAEERRSLRGTIPWTELTLHPEGHPRAKTFNPILQRVWDSRNRLSWIIARVILYELEMSVAEFCRLGFIEKPATLHHLFRPISKKTLREGHADGSLAALLKGWRALSEHEDKESPRSIILKEGCEKILTSVLKGETSPVSKLLRWWRLRAYEEFENSWGREFRAFRKNGCERFLSISFNELISVAKGAGLIPEDLTGKQLWNHPVAKEARKAFLAEAEVRRAASSAATLVMMLEFAGYGTSAESLRRDPAFASAGLTWNAARDLAHFRAISSEAAAPILEILARKKLFPEKDVRVLKAALQEECEAALTQPSFSHSVTTLLQNLRFTNSDIADALQVPKSKNTTLSPPDCVRLAINGMGYQRECPSGALALLAAGSEEHFFELVDLRRAEIACELGLRRGAREPHPLMLERLLWGVDAEQLGIDKKVLENTEWRRRSTRLTPEQERVVLERVVQIGMGRALDGLRVILSDFRPGSTTQTISGLSSLTGGITGISVAGQVGIVRAERLITGQEIPPLCVLQKIFRSYGIKISPTVARRWYLDFAEQRKTDQVTPAARALAVEIFSRWRDVGTFVHSVGASRATELSLRKFLRGVDFSADDFSSLLESLGISKDSDRHRILVAIDREQDAVKAARTWLAELPTDLRRTWMRDISKLAAVAKADLRFRDAQVSQREASLAELFELKSRGRLSEDITLPQSLRAREAKALTTMMTLAGLTAYEIIALSESFAGSELQASRTATVSHHEKLWQSLQNLGLTAKRLAPILVDVFVENGAQAKDGLLTAIDRAIEARKFSPIVPYGVIAALVSHNSDELEELLEMERSHLRANADSRLMDWEIEAKVWGVHPNALFDVDMGPSDSKAVQMVRNLGTRTCSQVLKELVADRGLGLSRKLLKSCMYRVGMMGFDFSKHVGVKSAALLGFVRGERALDWVRYSKCIEFAKVPAQGLVRLWWQLDLAETLEADPRWLSDRQRLGAALRADGNGQLTYLFPAHSADTDVERFRKALAALESGRYSDRRMKVVLEALKVAPSSAREIFLKNVFKNGSIERGITAVLTVVTDKKRTQLVDFDESPLRALWNLLSEEARLERAVTASIPDTSSQVAFLSYANTPLLTPSISGHFGDAFDIVRMAFVGATRGELRRALAPRFQGRASDRESDVDTFDEGDRTNEPSAIPQRILYGDDSRSWDECVAELQRWPRENFQSIQVLNDTRQLLADGEVVALTVLGDALFGINRETTSTERVEVMSVRVRLGMPVTHPGDQRVLIAPRKSGSRKRSSVESESQEDLTQPHSFS
jgi:hypothetical protein